MGEMSERKFLMVHHTSRYYGDNHLLDDRRLVDQSIGAGKATEQSFGQTTKWSKQLWPM